jgi:hypothetical protein
MHPFVHMATTKMGAGGFEIGRLALGDLMNVDGVFAWRKTLDIERDFDTLGRGRQCGRANTLALGILDVYGNGFIGGANLADLQEE